MTESRLVLGLDPSLTQFGWAIHNPSATGSDRCVDRGRFKTKSKDLFLSRYKLQRQRVSELLNTHPHIKRVGIEFPIFNDLFSEGMYGLFLFVCEALYDSKVDVVFFSPNQLKAHARSITDLPPKWKMEKKEMVDAAKIDTGGSGRWNHNEADAYWCAIAASRFWRYYEGEIEESDLTEVEKHQFTHVHTYVRGRKQGQTFQKGLIFKEDSRFFLWSQR